MYNHNQSVSVKSQSTAEKPGVESRQIKTGYTRMYSWSISIIFSISIAAMNIDIIWFGIIFTLMIECALITPPVGLNIYVLQAIGNAKMGEIGKGVAPFVAIMLFTVLVIYFFPDIALYIPFKL